MPSASPDEPVVFDRKLALYHAGDEPEVLRAIVEMFLDQVSERIGALEAAIRDEDAPALERAAHALKGTAATLALAKVQEAAYALEQLGSVGHPSEAPPRVAELRKAVDEAAPALRGVLAVGS